MNTLDISTALQSLGKLDITAQTTEEVAGAAMEMLGNFNQCVAGLVSFSGATPWERHPDDEFLYVQEGTVKVTLLAEEGVGEVSLNAGSVSIVPAGLWHRQFSQSGVKLLFITSREGNEHSAAEDPRTDEK
jgi:mannose-6-phosphate isomerase-like protein (cupin superfamily)